MTRGPVEDVVVDLPMRIKVQQESEREFIAALPAWILPSGLVVAAETRAAAITALKIRMKEYWG